MGSRQSGMLKRQSFPPQKAPVMSAATVPAFKRMRKGSSSVWEHVDRLVEDRCGHQVTVARCKVDGCAFVNPKTGTWLSTGAIKRHLENVHQIEVKLRGQDSDLADDKRFRFDRVLAIAMIRNGWPLSTPGLQGTRYLASRLVPGWVPCSSETMYGHHIKEMYTHCMSEFAEDSKDGVCYQFFVDGWSSELNKASASSRACIGVCCTSLNRNFERRKRTLCVRELAGKHTATNIYDGVLVGVLKDTSIKLEDIIDWATDNHTSEVSLIEIVTELAPDTHHSRCYGHTLNLSVQDALKVRVMLPSVKWKVMDGNL